METTIEARFETSVGLLGSLRRSSRTEGGQQQDRLGLNRWRIQTNLGKTERTAHPDRCEYRQVFLLVSPTVNSPAYSAHYNKTGAKE